MEDDSYEFTEHFRQKNTYPRNDKNYYLFT